MENKLVLTGSLTTMKFKSFKSLALDAGITACLQPTVSTITFPVPGQEHSPSHHLTEYNGDTLSKYSY